MKTKYIACLFFLIAYNSFAQLEDGSHCYMNEDVRVDFEITDGGWEIESAVIIFRRTGELQEGTGIWHKINMQGADEDYDGPEGFYEFQTNECSYEFDAPINTNDNIILSKFDCSNAKTNSKYELSFMIVDRMEEGEEDFEEGYDENDDYAYAESYDEDDEINYLDKNEAENYFTVFLNKSGNELADVFLEHQPHLSDCKFLFKESIYRETYNAINLGFSEIDEQMEIQKERFKGLQFCRATEFNTSEIISGNCNVCPGSAKHLADKVNPNIVCYSIEFLKSEDSEAGSRYALFTKINDRWVYFPIN